MRVSRLAVISNFNELLKYVCTHHFDDKYLNQYIQENSEDGICSYCHRKGRVIDMSALADHIVTTISIFFNDIDSEGLPLASSYYDDEFCDNAKSQEWIKLARFYSEK